MIQTIDHVQIQVLVQMYSKGGFDTSALRCKLEDCSNFVCPLLPL